jgi:hypothetical protein
MLVLLRILLGGCCAGAVRRVLCVGCWVLCAGCCMDPERRVLRVLCGGCHAGAVWRVLCGCYAMGTMRILCGGCYGAMRAGAMRTVRSRLMSLEFYGFSSQFDVG